jgi:Ribbon-helix-helix protein, copG family.
MTSRAPAVYPAYTPDVSATTIKVPSELRDRLNAEARGSGVTVAAVIERLLEDRERASLFEQMRVDRARMTDAERAELADEYRAWSEAGASDLVRREPHA